MKISTRGRYALRVMCDLAEHTDGNDIPLRDIAERQEISQKYLESIMFGLSKAGLVDGKHGKGGGYRLVRDCKDYTVLEILQTTEGDLAPVACLDCGAPACGRAQECRTLPLWKDFYRLVAEYFNGVTLAELTGADGEKIGGGGTYGI